ncbi:hypothetical protein BMS3Bbin12_00552 [bacterium BMS3Bbin12]|nr:hypothetical protein BMS3Abin12_00707 [bacterium BMS3Abin12]GBE47392.1 hypothetical protein BMS3Bbin12_00552 [bacterium BMS3Bbin12]
MDDRAIRTRHACIGDHVLFGSTPLIANPHRNFVAGALRWFGAEVQCELPGFFALAMHELHGPHRILYRGPKELGAFAAHSSGIIDEPGFPVAELGLPFAALPRLQTVLVIQLHQRAGGYHLVQPLRYLTPQCLPIFRQIFHQQIRQRTGASAKADINTGFSRKLADQEHQRTQPRLQMAIRSPVVLLDNGFIDLAE